MTWALSETGFRLKAQRASIAGRVERPHRTTMAGDVNMAYGAGGLLTGARILVVEDNPLIAVDLSCGLSDAGAEVVGPFAHARTALPMAQAENLTGAVLDVNLADGNVTPVARALVARNVPFLFCTGVDLPKELRDRLPDAVVLQKPCDPAEVAATLARMVSPRRARW